MNQLRLLAESYKISGPGIQPNTSSPAAPLENIISSVIGILTVVAAIFFALQIIFAGYSFFTTEGDQKKMQEARKRITEAVLGLFIVVIALGATALIGRLVGLGNVLDFSGNWNNLKVK